jgi:hypothetical protein
MELAEWIQMADKKGLIATIDDFAALPKGKPIPVTSLDDCSFWLTEYPAKYPELLPNNNCSGQSVTTYDPSFFFSPFRFEFTRTSGIETHVAPCYVNGEPIMQATPQLKSTHSVDRWTKKLYKMGIYSITANRQAASGSGDGWTRYILWSRLEASDMPSVCWRH